jgi:site-specific recombinase XerD
MPPSPQGQPTFQALIDSWELALRADGYSPRTLTSYLTSMRFFTGWLATHHPDAGPRDVTRDHVRAWIVHLRETTSSGTARSRFPAIRHFYRWAIDEHEATADPTDGLRTPAPNQVHTPVLTVDQIRAILGTCSGTGFVNRRDAAILYVFIDGGLRLSEVGALTTGDVNLRDRVLFVEGKGSNRSGPRRRAVPIGVKACRAIDRYLRERSRHPYCDMPQVWLGARGRDTLSDDGIERMLQRRAASVGVKIHPHMFRHTWASQFRAAGGSEGDLMVLGGWRNRAMLDRYGASAAADRAHDSYRRLALGDRL